MPMRSCLISVVPIGGFKETCMVFKLFFTRFSAFHESFLDISDFLSPLIFSLMDKREFIDRFSPIFGIAGNPVSKTTNQICEIHPHGHFDNGNEKYYMSSVFCETFARHGYTCTTLAPATIALGQFPTLIKFLTSTLDQTAYLTKKTLTLTH